MFLYLRKLKDFTLIIMSANGTHCIMHVICASLFQKGYLYSHRVI